MIAQQPAFWEAQTLRKNQTKIVRVNNGNKWANEEGDDHGRPCCSAAVCFGNSGIITRSGHFFLDHDDIQYSGRYILPNPIYGVNVEVTQHAGSESDKWLLHELERDFRNYFGLPGKSFRIRIVNDQTIFATESGGWIYRWVSGNKVINIEYTDLQMEKPEPLKVVEAYLAKHPSTLGPVTIAEIRSVESKTKWIKDEMERRLWLADKWLLQRSNKGMDESEITREMSDQLNVFIDYREKYFGVSAENDKKALYVALLHGDNPIIQNKLTEYKQWWKKNKGKEITL